jgi:mono/diheme cytochrome c family protein
MTMSSKHWLPAVLALASVSVFALAAQQNGAPVTAPSKTAPAAKRAVQQPDEGQRVFQQHCSRCHTAPDGFSPRISGTVVRHMRVRASLSQHEEQELLRFFNP